MFRVILGMRLAVLLVVPVVRKGTLLVVMVMISFSISSFVGVRTVLVLVPLVLAVLWTRLVRTLVCPPPVFRWWVTSVVSVV